MARQMICVVVKHKHKSNIKHRKHTVCSLTDQWPASLKLTQEPSVGKLVTGSQESLFLWFAILIQSHFSGPHKLLTTERLTMSRAPRLRVPHVLSFLCELLVLWAPRVVTCQLLVCELLMENRLREAVFGFKFKDVTRFGRLLIDQVLEKKLCKTKLC